MPFALYIPIGPSATEVERVIDAIASATHYHDDLYWIVLVDDTGDGNLASAIPADLLRVSSLSSGVQLTILKNPRDGLGHGNTGGLCVGGLTALRWIHRFTDAEFVLKIDTDTLIIARCSERIETAFRSRPFIGLLGAIGDNCCEGRTYAVINALLLQFRLALQIDGQFRDLSAEQQKIVARWGICSESQYANFLTVRALLDSAMNTFAYRGEYCQGGGYAVSRSLLNAMAALGAFSERFMWRDLPCGEDVMMAIYSAATGHEIRDLSGRGGLFGVQPSGLPYNPQRLVDLGYGVVHSVKGPQEGDIRKYYRELRVIRGT